MCSNSVVLYVCVNNAPTMKPNIWLKVVFVISTFASIGGSYQFTHTRKLYLVGKIIKLEPSTFCPFQWPRQWFQRLRKPVQAGHQLRRQESC